jgi:hypothetical protein
MARACLLLREPRTFLLRGNDPEAEALFEGQKVNWPIETFRRSRFHDSLRDEEQFEGIRGIRHGYYY